MNKKILFVMESLVIGGAEKSLVTILSLLDYNKYDVDLQLFNDEGEFMDLLPKEVNILPLDEKIKYFRSNFKTAWLKYLLHGQFLQSYHSFCWLVKCLIMRYLKHKEYVGWKHIKYLMDNLTYHYDVSIGFLEKKSIYYCVDKTIADRKIGFIHNDYLKIEHNIREDKKYFEKLYKIPTVSEHCKEVLIRTFSEYESKFCVIKNMVSPDIIRKMSKEDVGFIKEKDIKYLCTVGRLVEQKGIDIAIKVSKRVIDSGYKIKWFVCGEGSERNRLERLIKSYNLENTFILLGGQTNPYKYMEFCDVYVQPSRYEGYGITVAEAKSLCKPIVASAIPEFKEQIINEKTGLLYNNEDELYEDILKLIKVKELSDFLSTNLMNKYDNINRSELKKIEELLN